MSIIKNLFSFLIALLFSLNSWSQQPPELSASGNQAYCPLSETPIATDFNITNPDAEIIDRIYIQISEGYISTQDRLELRVNHPNITVSNFDTLEGKLELKWTGAGTQNEADIALIAAVKDVVFKNNSPTPFGERAFSITIGQANYLPSTGHYYEYIEAERITWSGAKTAAEGKTYYGALEGYLATITSYEEAQICGEQAAGQGWIGGSDNAQEGTWKWVTGPEAGKTFWFGLWGGNSNGADYSYTNWAYEEPNDWPDGNSVPGQENYAHVYDNGEWNDYPNYQNNIKGYIVEYGGMPNDLPLNISAKTKIYIPEITSTTAPTAICGSGVATVEATANTGNVIWFDAQTGGTKLGSGNTYTTPTAISTTTSYYALASSDGICETGLRTKIDAVVNTIPTITATTNNLICGSGTGTITATASAGELNWYATDSGGTYLGTGTSFTSPVISTDTTYFVDATENGCTTSTRTPITITVQHTATPIATSPQTFCDVENATLDNLIITGSNILWYANSVGGIALDPSEVLVDNTTYYATQTIIGCESPTRLPVTISVFETVVTPANIPVLEECDTNIDGDDTNGSTEFDLTKNETILLNGKDATDYTFRYFTDPAYTVISEITNPTNFENTIKNGQPIYVRISNNLNTSCYTDTSFEIKVNSLPEIEYSVTLKNCDEDGNPDGFTDFNLTESNPVITKGDANLVVNYYLTISEAENGTTPPLNPSPFNNADAIANKVYARVENASVCYRVSTVTLETIITSFPSDFNYEINECEIDNDKAEFDLTAATSFFLSKLPPQSLTIHYYKDLTDAQLERDEILPQNAYISLSKELFIRVESSTGDCFGIGKHLTLTVNPRPEFEIDKTAITCLNLLPIEIIPFNEKNIDTYEWFNDQGESIGNKRILTVSKKGVYTAIATSSSSCTSFEQKITVTESNIATITEDDILITDDSSNNTITIKTENLGIGDYEFSLDNGSFQEAPVFDNVAPGIHTIYVQDINNCGIADIDVSVVGYLKFFTPNGDGENDYWQIKGVSKDFYPTSLIYIYDRFGKLITQINPSSQGWDGYTNGQPLPATDYWFTARLIDKEGVTREKKGHFSLIR